MMKKNILIFRSAKHPVVEKNIKYITEKHKECVVYLCVQEECKERYGLLENVKLIVFPNGMFNYSNTVLDNELCDKLTGGIFDEIYIPFSTVEPHCDEIEKIVLKIMKQRKVII